MSDVILRRYKETDTQFATREFNYCMYHVGRCHDLQAERIRITWLEYAKFYQREAARWYERALECRARYNTIVAREAIELIPGTRVRWDEIFQMFGRGQRVMRPNSILYVDTITTENILINDVKFSIRQRGPHHPIYFLDESRFIGDGVDELAALLNPDPWDDIFSLISPTVLHRRGNIEITPKFENTKAALKLANSSAYGKINKPFTLVIDPRWKTVSDPRPREHHYVSPREKYDNPRDVPLTLKEVSNQLKRWLE